MGGNLSSIQRDNNLHYRSPHSLFFLLSVDWHLLWLSETKVYKMKNITIHHECPCRIEISHPRGRNFNQGRGLPSPWLNSDPEGEISLSYMDRLMMDRFSPTFPRFFVGT